MIPLFKQLATPGPGLQLTPHTRAASLATIFCLALASCGLPRPFRPPDVIAGLKLYPVLTSEGGPGDVMAELPDGTTHWEGTVNVQTSSLREDKNVQPPAIDNTSITTFGGFLNFVGGQSPGPQSPNIRVGLASKLSVSVSAIGDRAIDLSGQGLRAATMAVLGQVDRITGARYYVTRRVIWAHDIQFTFDKQQMAGVDLELLKEAKLDVNAKTETTTHVTYPIQNRTTSYKVYYVPQEIPEAWWPEAKRDPLAETKDECGAQIGEILRAARLGFPGVGGGAQPSVPVQTDLPRPLGMLVGTLDRASQDGLATWVCRSAVYSDQATAATDFAVLASCVKGSALSPELVDDRPYFNSEGHVVCRRVRVLAHARQNEPAVFAEARSYLPMTENGDKAGTLELQVSVAAGLSSQ